MSKKAGPATDKIIESAQEKDADLIVMTTRGRTGLSHALMGSAAEKAARQAPYPVLTIRPDRKPLISLKGVNMKSNVEKRAFERHCYPADIAFSYFNKEHSYSAQIINLGTGGICFKTSFFLQPGATVYIRLKKIHPNASGTAFCEGLRFVTLAEVKWCSEVPGNEVSHYAAGVKYFEPPY